MSAKPTKTLYNKLVHYVKANSPACTIYVDTIRDIVKMKPTTEEEMLQILRKYDGGNANAVHVPRIQSIIAEHDRQMEHFRDCVCEFRAFVGGGVGGIEVLKRVWPSILKHYAVEDEKDVRIVLEHVGLGLSNEKKLFYARENLEREYDIMCSQNSTQ